MSLKHKQVTREFAGAVVLRTDGPATPGTLRGDRQQRTTGQRMPEALT